MPVVGADKLKQPEILGLGLPIWRFWVFLIIFNLRLEHELELDRFFSGI